MYARVRAAPWRAKPIYIMKRPRFELGEMLYYLRGASEHIPIYMTLASKIEIQSNQYARSFGPTEGHAPLCHRSYRGGKLPCDSL